MEKKTITTKSITLSEAERKVLHEAFAVLSEVHAEACYSLTSSFTGEMIEKEQIFSALSILSILSSETEWTETVRSGGIALAEPEDEELWKDNSTEKPSGVVVLS